MSNITRHFTSVDPESPGRPEDNYEADAKRFVFNALKSRFHGLKLENIMLSTYRVTEADAPELVENERTRTTIYIRGVTVPGPEVLESVSRALGNAPKEPVKHNAVRPISLEFRGSMGDLAQLKPRLFEKNYRDAFELVDPGIGHGQC